MLTTFAANSVRKVTSAQLSGFENANTCVGQLFYVTDTNALYRWDGASMVRLSEADDPSGFIVPGGAVLSVGRVSTVS